MTLPPPTVVPPAWPYWSYVFAGIAAAAGIVGGVVACVSFVLWVSS